MAIIAVTTVPSVWTCHWSRPGYRLSRVAEQDQPEAEWVCVRTGARRDVDAMGCERCPHWERDPQAA